MSFVRLYGHGRHRTRRADVLASAAADALVGVHDGNPGAVRALDQRNRIYGAVAKAGGAGHAFSRCEAAILVPHGFADVDVPLHEGRYRLYRAGRADFAALSAVDRAISLVERHLRLAEVLEARRGTQHLAGARLDAKLATDALRPEVLY